MGVVTIALYNFLQIANLNSIFIGLIDIVSTE